MKQPEQMDLFSTKKISAVPSKGADATHRGRISAERSTRSDGRTASLEARFADFTHDNPHVMPEMLALARQKLARGQKRIGVKALWEELREHLRVKQLGDYALNNSFTALAARELIRMLPALEGVIELRVRKAATKRG